MIKQRFYTKQNTRVWPSSLFILVLSFLILPAAQADLFKDKLGFGSQKQSFLPVDEAFIPTIESVDADTLIARWQIEDGYYLYKDKMQINSGNQQITATPVDLPMGKVKNDPLFGEVEVYYGDIEIPVKLQRSGQQTQKLELNLAYQGCAEDGICYPPVKKVVAVNLTPVSDTTPFTATPPEMTAAPDAGSGAAIPGAALSETDSIAASLASKPLLISLALFFGFGLALALTPCVFPMIPILSGILVGQMEKGKINTTRSFTLSLVYVLGMAFTYAVVGVVAGIFGKNLQAAFQSPIILASFSAVFIILALSMFGFYNIQLPSKWQTRLSSIGDQQKGGSLKGAALMGIFSAIIVGPCVAPPLAGALIFIGQSGNALLGGAALFVMALGMGIPLLLLGASAGKLLPKAGVWMETIKHIFGVLMLGIAIWLLERILPGPVILVLWGSLLIASAVYMGALHALTEISSGWQRLWKSLGIVLLIYGGLLIIGAASDNDDVFHPLKKLTVSQGSAHAQNKVAQFQQIKGMDGLQAAIQTAQAQNKPLMLDFYADWCIECKRMERNTFSAPEVQKKLANAILIQADVTPNDAQDQALLQSFELYGPPAILFFSPDGKEQRHLRITGYSGPESFVQHISQIF